MPPRASKRQKLDTAPSSKGKSPATARARGSAQAKGKGKGKAQAPSSAPVHHPLRGDQDDDDSDDDDEDEDEEGDDDEDDGDESEEDDAEVAAQSESPTKRAKPPPKPKAKPIVTASAGDAYLLRAYGSSKTSTHLLSDSLSKPFTRTSYAKALEKYDARPSPRTPAPATAKSFSRWSTELDLGFNLLFHGMGSKRRDLNAFAQYVRRKKGNAIVVDSYDPAVSFSDVLTAVEGLVPALAGAVASGASTAASQSDKRVQKLLAAMDKSTPKQPIYLVIHSLDRGALAPNKVLTLLASLAAHPSIRLVASIDHVRAMLLFTSSLVTDLPSSSSTNSRTFSFLYHELSTLVPYTTEVSTTFLLSRLLPPTIYPPPASTHSSKHSTLPSALFVLQTVTPSSRALFLLLCRLQLDRSSASTSTSKDADVALADLQSQAVDEMIALGAQQVQGLLAEFRDHGVVKDGNGEEGRTVRVALRKDELEELLERAEDG